MPAYANSEQTIVAMEDGRMVPADPGNTHYAALLASGVTIAGYSVPAPTGDDVRAEASRRMQALVGARDAAHLEIVITNGLREGVRLQEKRIGHLADPAANPDWSAEEALRAETLKRLDAAIEAIRAASNAIEPEPPVDYREDRYWPRFGGVT